MSLPSLEMVGIFGKALVKLCNIDYATCALYVQPRLD